MEETKAEKFQRLARKRIPAALKQIELIANLSASQYENSPQEARRIIEDLEGGVAAVAKAFGVENQTGFVENQTGFVEPKPEPDLFKTEPDLSKRASVDGRDRADIRAAVHKLRAGDVSSATRDLNKIILGWPLADWD